jgi:hypothetical protein
MGADRLLAIVPLMQAQMVRARHHAVMAGSSPRHPIIMRTTHGGRSLCPAPNQGVMAMTTLATIVFKSGVAVEVPMGALQAQALLDGFDESWDEEGPQIAVPMAEGSSGCRLIGSEIIGILVSADGDEDETGDEDEDDADDKDDDEDADDDDADERDDTIEDDDDFADAEAGKLA